MCLETEVETEGASERRTETEEDISYRDGPGFGGVDRDGLEVISEGVEGG